ncbi:hypothetical protein [Zhongshania sp.]|uniref:hypothetical protein n=1 Tax=Zhongshania sp. TaxID=1971902 RepID=UPI003564F86E
MSIFKGKKKNWMIVLHKHHTSGMGWRHELLVDATPGEAEAYALVKAERWRGSDIPKVSGTAIELPDIVQVVTQGAIDT